MPRHSLWKIPPTPALSRGRKRLAWFGLSVAVLVFTAMTVGGALGGTAAWQRIPQETAVATGTVVKTGDCDAKGTLGSIARFSVHGVPYKAEAACSARLGAHVPVRYDPADPAHNDDGRSNAIMLFVVSAAGILLFAVTVRSMISLRRAPTVTKDYS